MSRQFNVLFFGDIVGEIGLDYVIKSIPQLKNLHNPLFIIANGENVWNGKGINEIEANKLFKAGVDVITTGNHIWENWKSRPLLDSNNKVIRPANYPDGNSGVGVTKCEKDGFILNVVQLQGRTFMSTIDCPFKKADEILSSIDFTKESIILDFHAEATAEKSAMGWYLDGRISALIGTHTHVQTADACLLPAGTAFITDVGMCGPYDSVLGMRTDIALSRFLLQTAHKFELAENDIRLAYCVITIDGNTNKAISLQSFINPSLENGISK